MTSIASVTALSRPEMIRRSWDRPRLSVVIVNYQHWDDTARLVRQLSRSSALHDGRAEIRIIDNHSRPHPLISRIRRSPGVSLLRWRKNRGFARAVNEACRLSQGQWILLLNPDTSVPPNFLDRVLESLDHRDDRVGIVGFRLQNSDCSVQLSAGFFPTLRSSLLRLLLPRAIRKYSHPQTAGEHEVDWVTGSCLLIRSECFHALQGLDPRFFLYYEDVDLCFRARREGWSVVFDPSLSIIHHRPLHSREVPPHLRMITRHGLMTYANKHWAFWETWILGRMIASEARLRQFQAILNGNRLAFRLFGEVGELVRAILREEEKAVGERLGKALQYQERHHDASAHRAHSVPASVRSAGSLSCQRAPV
ncbi:MAG: glycosyltransferase family 2 protein [Gemmataceae bacterium]